MTICSIVDLPLLCSLRRGSANMYFEMRWSIISVLIQFFDCVRNDKPRNNKKKKKKKKEEPFLGRFFGLWRKKEGGSRFT